MEEKSIKKKPMHQALAFNRLRSWLTKNQFIKVPPTGQGKLKKFSSMKAADWEDIWSICDKVKESDAQELDSAQNLLQFIQFSNHKQRSRKGATGAKRKGDTPTNRAQSAGATPLGRVVQSMAEVPCDGEDVELEGEEEQEEAADKLLDDFLHAMDQRGGGGGGAMGQRGEGGGAGGGGGGGGGAVRTGTSMDSIACMAMAVVHEEIRPILDLIFGGAASRSDLTEG